MDLNDIPHFVDFLLKNKKHYMKKTFKHNNKSLTVEVQEKAKVDIHIGWQPNPKRSDVLTAENEKEPVNIPVYEKQTRNVIIGYIGDKEESRKVIELNDPHLTDHAEAMENELMRIVDKGKASASKKLSAKGYK